MCFAFFICSCVIICRYPSQQTIIVDLFGLLLDPVDHCTPFYGKQYTFGPSHHWLSRTKIHISGKFVGL